MRDVAELLRSELERLAPPVGPPAWEEVLAAAQDGRGQRRSMPWVLVAAAVAAVVVATVATPLGPALARGLDGFSDWLTGTPGAPVSEEEQRAFDVQNERTWLGFPEGTELRRLIVRDVDGFRVELLGFRVGDARLCLRLNVTGAAKVVSTKCAPLAELRRDGGPVRVLITDEHVGRGNKRAWYGLDRLHSARLLVTAGVAADGVSAVVLRDAQGRHEVPTEANAFLYIAREPEVAQRVEEVWARTDAGLVAVPFAPLPSLIGGTRPPAAAPPAPPIERRLDGGRIGWVDRREPRGEPLDVLPERTRRAVLGMHAGPPLRQPTDVLFGRVLAPDPAQPLRIVLTLNAHRPDGPPAGLCHWFVSRGGGSGGGCTPYPEVFARSPVSLSMSGGGTGAFVQLMGFVSDGVARVEVVTAAGERFDAALRDNVFAAEVARAKLPARLVGYDDDGRVVAVTRPSSDLGNEVGPARGKPELLFRVEGPAGSFAELSVGPSSAGGECQYLKVFVDRRHTGVGVSCKGPGWTGSPVQVHGQWGAPPRFVAGRVREDVKSVRVRFADGGSITLQPKRGYVLYAVPAERLETPRAAVAAEGLDAAGRVVARQPFAPPRP